MTTATYGRTLRRRLLAVVAVASVLGLPMIPVHAAAVPAAPASAHYTVEIWRLHPNKLAARAPRLNLKLSITSNGDGGALMVVEDRSSSYDVATGSAFVYAELANDHDYPIAYDNAEGITSADCSVPDSCLGLEGAPLNWSPTFTLSKVTGPDGRALPYSFRDFYVGVINAHVNVRPLAAGWSVSKANSVADMFFVQNRNTKQGVGIQTANYTVEQFNGEISVKTPDAAWSAAYAGLPCSNDLIGLPVPQSRATFTGMTYGTTSIPLSCAGNDGADGIAAGPTTWRLTSQPTGAPDNADAIAATQNLNRMVVLVVNRPKIPTRPRLILPPKHPLLPPLPTPPARPATNPQHPNAKSQAFAAPLAHSHHRPHLPLDAVLLVALVVAIRRLGKRYRLTS